MLVSVFQNIDQKTFSLSLNYSERYKLDGGDLIIKSAGFDHIGLYMCLIRNFVGLDVQPTYVIVEGML